MTTTRKKTEEEPQAEEEPTPEPAKASAPKAEAHACANCGEPATQKTTNPSVSTVYYCDRHARQAHEGVQPL